MDISLGAEKAFDKSQHPFMVENSHPATQRKELSLLIKGSSEKPTASLTSHDGILNTSTLGLGELPQARQPCSPLWPALLAGWPVQKSEWWANKRLGREGKKQN